MKHASKHVYRGSRFVIGKALIMLFEVLFQSRGAEETHQVGVKHVPRMSPQQGYPTCIPAFRPLGRPALYLTQNWTKPFVLAESKNIPMAVYITKTKSRNKNRKAC